MSEDVVCSECGGVPRKQIGEAKLAKKGWDFEGEYGARCPACVKSANVPVEANEGLDGVAEALAATPKEEIE